MSLFLLLETLKQLSHLTWRRKRLSPLHHPRKPYAHRSWWLLGLNLPLLPAFLTFSRQAHLPLSQDHLYLRNFLKRCCRWVPGPSFLKIIRHPLCSLRSFLGCPLGGSTPSRTIPFGGALFFSDHMPHSNVINDMYQLRTNTSSEGVCG